MDSYEWVISPLRDEARALAAELGLPLPIAQVLTNRNILTPEEAETFLFGTLDNLHDPYLFADMDRAVERIRKAIRLKEKILVFGDYDVDGVLSVVILLKALRSLGAEIDYYIPERLKEGYGIKEEHLGIVKERMARLVISVDCGIKAAAFAARAAEEGVDVIITDHHLPGETLPEVAALINPVIKNSSYPYKSLAGVGVVFKLLQALLEREGRGGSLPHYAKLVAIGTIADVAELRGENRLLVKQGLKGLENASNRGLRSLLENCGLQKKRITEGDVGFRIAPRINAAGRMGAADVAVRLFFSENEAESYRLALRLDELNAKRQNEEERIYNEARERVRAASLDRRYKLLVLGCEGWHRGIIGIVASKLKDFFYRPVLLFNYENEKAHGSGRSISEFSLIECLDECREFFLDYGGHTLAVGCVLMRDRLDVFKQKVNAVVRERLEDEALKRKITVDAQVDLSGLDLAFIENFLRLAPFGVGNAKPVFLARGVEVLSAPQLIQNRHVKFLARQNGRTFEALGWEKGDWLGGIRRGARVDVVFSLQSSTFLGEERFSLSLEDIRPSGRERLL
jgi:single-stranded-DNA-specific exonuclease